MFDRELEFSQAVDKATGSSFTVSDTEFQGTSSNYIPEFSIVAERCLPLPGPVPRGLGG